MKKRQKKIVALITVVLLALAFVLVGCLPEAPPLPPEGANITIIIGDTAHTLTTQQTTLGGALDELHASEDIALVTGGVATDLHGRWLVSIGDLEPGYREFVAVYIATSIPWGLPPSIQHNGRTFYSTPQGIDGVPVLVDMYYLFVIRSW